jgi:hypothetical protein
MFFYIDDDNIHIEELPKLVNSLDRPLGLALAIYAAKDAAFIKALMVVRGILATSILRMVVLNFWHFQSSRRAVAIASLKVGSDLRYQLAVSGVS